VACGNPSCGRGSIMSTSNAAIGDRRDSMPTIVRATFHAGKLAQPRAEHKLHNIAVAIPQRVSFVGSAVALTPRARYASDQSHAEAFSQAVTGHHMSGFDKREEGFERKFAHDEEVRFKARARRNKLLGLWAAEKLGLAAAAADTYAKDIVMVDFEGAGDDDVFAKIRRDFDAKAVAQSDHQIRRTMDELMAKAVEDVKAGR
jgi:hypothetical protein